MYIIYNIEEVFMVVNDNHNSVINSNYVIYHDLRYPTSWILDTLSQEIVDYLTSNNNAITFTEVNADQLRDWMQNLVNDRDATHHVVVFSQDAVPVTVFFDKSDNLIREYLNYGGRVVWIGDIPFIKRGHTKVVNPGIVNGKIVTQPTYQRIREDLGINDVYAILGFFPGFAFSESKIYFSENGRLRGLTQKWYSIRPVHPRFIDSILRRIFRQKKNILAESILTKPLKQDDINPQRVKEEDKITYSKIKSTTEILRVYFSLPAIIFAIIAFIFGLFSGGLNLTSGNLINNIVGVVLIIIILGAITGIIYSCLPKRFVSAWIKNFNHRGEFIRIWDYRPECITNSMKNDLYQIATRNMN